LCERSSLCGCAGPLICSRAVVLLGLERSVVRFLPRQRSCVFVHFHSTLFMAMDDNTASYCCDFFPTSILEFCSMLRTRKDSVHCFKNFEK
jgi:hypothetical protein